MATVKDQEKEQRRRFDHRKRKYTHQAAAGRHLQKRVKQRWWLPSKRHRKATEPATVSDDEQLRLDVAAVVVDLSWSWAPLRMALATMYMRS